MRVVRLSWKSLIGFVVGSTAFALIAIAAEPKPHWAGNNYAVFYHDGDYDKVRTAAENIQREEVFLVGTHANGERMLGPDGQPMSAADLAQYLVHLPNFNKISLVYLNVCAAGRCQATPSIAEQVLTEIKKLAPDHDIAVLSPRGIVDVSVRSYEDFPDRAIISVVSERSVIKREAGGPGAPKRESHLNDHNSFMLTEWKAPKEGAAPKAVSVPMAGTVVSQYFHWMFSGPPATITSTGRIDHHATHEFRDTCAHRLLRWLYRATSHPPGH